MGVKAAVVWLNGNGYRTRRGARWGIGPLHKLLTNPAYKGEAHFNRTDSKTRTAKSATEHIIVPVDPIIDPAMFDAVQAQLKARNPKLLPPRVVTGPILLTGLATCATCGLHRQVGALSLLCLRGGSTEGQGCLRGALAADGWSGWTMP